MKCKENEQTAQHLVWNWQMFGDATKAPPNLAFKKYDFFW